jgi:hypothetical protein
MKRTSRSPSTRIREFCINALGISIGLTFDGDEWRVAPVVWRDAPELDLGPIAAGC